MILEAVQLVVLGLAVGLVSAVLGLGGGILIVPFLPLITSLTQQEVLATSLFSIFWVVLVNTWRFQARGWIDWRLAWMFGPTTALGAFASGRTSLLLSESTLKIILAGVLGVFALQMLRDSTTSPSAPEPRRRRSWTLPAVGLFNGWLSGMTGIGSGIILNPLMMRWRLTDEIKVSPTANAIMIFSTGFGALAFAMELEPGQLAGGRLGQVHLDKAFLLTFPAWLIGPWARRWQGRLAPRARRQVFAFLLIVLCVQVLWSGWGGELF